MPRTNPEWIGRNDNAPVPLRVRLRVLERYQARCGNCCRAIRPGDRWTCDHRIALINGGTNRERNLWPLCEWCNPLKNASDLRRKAQAYRKRLAYFGMKIPKGRPIIGSIRSGWKRFMDGTWARR